MWRCTRQSGPAVGSLKGRCRGGTQTDLAPAIQHRPDDERNEDEDGDDRDGDPETLGHRVIVPGSPR